MIDIALRMKWTHAFLMLAVLLFVALWFFTDNEDRNQLTEPYKNKLPKASQLAKTKSDRQSKVVQSNSNAPRGSDVWNKLENKLQLYVKDFTPSLKIGSGRQRWLNSPEVRFWLEQLKSEDPAVVAKAAEILEGANQRAYMANANAGKKHESQFTREEWQSRLVFDIMFATRCYVATGRLTANALNPDGTVPMLSSEEQRYVNSGDNNDSLLLKDAQEIMEFYVPRLRSSDSETVDAAKSVLNLFTFDLFREESAEWWEDALRKTTALPPTNESTVFKEGLHNR